MKGFVLDSKRAAAFVVTCASIHAARESFGWSVALWYGLVVWALADSVRQWSEVAE